MIAGRFYFFLAALLITLNIAHVAEAQDTVIINKEYGKLDSIGSAILKQKRFLQVFVPAGYKPGSSQKYDVIYVLDGGNWNTGLINYIQHFVAGEGNMPPTIVVSILGIDRDKDLTPTHLADWKTSGGANNFLAFIKNEAIPYINKKYPCNGDNTLWGHSFGGLFVMYALLNEPATFKSFIAVDPSIWWDNCYIAKAAHFKLRALAGLNTTLFISGREGADGASMRIDSMNAALKKDAPANLIWKSMLYPDETHSSVRFKSIYDGLKFTYSGYSGGVEFLPVNGIVLKDTPLKIWYYNDPAKIHYTTDGTEPTLASPKVVSDIEIAAPAKLIVKSITNRSRYNSSASGNFKTGDWLLPAKMQKNAKPGGFKYDYYEGTWLKLPDFKKIKPIKQGITDSTFNIEKLPQQNNFALIISGQMKIEEDGYYIFIMDANTEASLWIGNQPVITADELHKSGQSYILPIKKGYHNFRIQYWHKAGPPKLNLLYVTPKSALKKDATVIPLQLQYSQR
ncbi:alpha/beta hydrolase-fold protein [Mucilaginibacter phyllosphaerae]|uniref:Alpha/beta superfamily hydrolase n=1 Tax=Mucilaginibacter phyllosphaerae TaxID=1812349 RepID=A0A4Y8A982_9SPHI|nr:alpha/beta hydrolase-fold protein [Mucilaginibacter phyllosphaerae]MBB3969617.1 putative alpha/beta superfamily hydrolase [Mucilaginibacter phyllosphaerae]TEW65004.1 hypothetical protein E2R65_13870 [Mucilaginibacter phyllosphaerae]GGH18576.1 hypothetical protein GCM10007352_29400 [Mucilaginibacter phyllosphaerae]